MARPRVALLGTPEVALPTLETLVSLKALDVVITRPDRPSGRGQNLLLSPVKHRALTLGMPLFQPNDWTESSTQDMWDSLKIDLAFVIAYGSILPTWMIDSCRLGVWNLHFSKLPRWRGAAPVNYAIWKGDEETGVSLMKLSPNLDAGPLLGYLSRPISLATDTQSLLTTLAQDGADLIKQYWPSLLQGSNALIDQDEKKVTWAPKLTKACGDLSPHQPAIEIHRQVRALQPWPSVEFKLDFERLKIRSVGLIKPSSLSTGTLSWSHGEGAWLTAGDGNAVELLLLQRPGKSIQTALQALQPWGHQGQRNLQST